MISAELLRRLDVPAPRYTSYPTVPEWSDTFDAADHARALARASLTPEQPLSLYVHIPFCKELCTYCGCNVVVTRDQARVERYLDALEREIAIAAAALGARHRVSRLHLGGGTPTFLDERQLMRLWRMLFGPFVLARDAEVALEIDPAVTRPEQLELLAALGCNRISMGVQDLDPDVQRAVNRIQTVEETARAIAHARQVGFGSVNLDLIYGLPRQTPASFARTMSQVVELRPDRVAVFSFAYVPAARPNQRRLQVADLPSSDAKQRLQEIADEQLRAAGFRAIGIDHYAREEDELARAAKAGTLWRDFQGYTTRRSNATVAFGVSGISDFGFAYAQNDHALGRHAEAVNAGRLATVRGKWLSEDDRRRRDIITDLMCNGRVDLGTEGAVYFADELESLAHFQADGLLTVDGGHVVLTPIGQRFARNVAMVFDAYVRSPGAARSFSRTV
jgi:oxygen-independent coproporphyrinogen-3 oxidase